MARKDVATKRGGKGDSVSTTREAWAHSGVQKEVTLSWSTSGNYGSSSISLNSLASTAKPIWYGIDGQPAKDQSDTMRKRNGIVQPFGARMKPTSMATAGTWNPTDNFQPTASPKKSGNIFHSSTTRNWASSENFPETSIVPTGVDGVWEQETTQKVDQDMSPTIVGRRGIVTKSDGPSARQKSKSFSDHNKAWNSQRKAAHSSDDIEGSASSSRTWRKRVAKQKRGEGLRRKPTASDINSIRRQKSWK